MSLWLLLSLWWRGHDVVDVLDRSLWQSCEWTSPTDGKVWLDNWNVSAFEDAQRVLLAAGRISPDQCLRPPFREDEHC